MESPASLPGQELRPCTRVSICNTKSRFVVLYIHVLSFQPAGFWDREDVTRPFVSQAVITDGKYFSFFCYQLNTVALSTQTDVDNPRKNLLWGTDSLKLYDRVEDGRVVGLNDSVIKLLVQFLINQP